MGAEQSLKAVEIEELKTRLKETEDTLEAIRHGAVDALVVQQSDRQQVFTLESADHTYRVLIESMSQGALTLTRTGTILYCNRRFSVIIGVPLEQVIGAVFTDILPVADKLPIQELLAMKNARDMPLEIEAGLTGDNPASVIISAALLPDTRDNAYMSIVVTDITERKRAEKAKDEFISLASHQLRTPATGVKQYLGMLLEGYVGSLEEHQAKFIATAYDSNEKQLVIINSILRTARIDSGVYKLVKLPQNLAAMVEMVAVDFQPLLLMRSQRLVTDIPAEVNFEVDAAEFSIVLTNLIENASKYAPDGTVITISARQTSKKTSLKITDRGVGIQPSDQDKIFEKFTRIDNVMSDTVTGSGLGLYWTKRIITMHGGKILVKSALGKGTTFTVELTR